MAVRIAQVATDLCASVDRRGQELRSLGAPVFVDRLDVGDTYIQEAARRIGIGGGERHGWLVIGRATARVDDDPAVRQLDDRGFAGGHHFAAEDVCVEV